MNHITNNATVTFIKLKGFEDVKICQMCNYNDDDDNISNNNNYYCYMILYYITDKTK